ncbi:MAG TPA: phenylacetate--CoA ligase [Bacteroidales bacterium]|nr:MAG: Phenylacetate-coenzyme A ligase [Bacteroidetes bacterium ADurb.Bin217]HPH16530.1 phenylacetate--CoA ligase [Bacteroidales bacterium]HPM12791.1 phenylacetate--CoA ligase [Bacteroidales bacterium]
MFWNKEIECSSRNELHNLQSKRLHDMLLRMYNNVPFYRNKFTELGIHPNDITNVSQLSSLPFTYKQDLRDNYPFGLFAVPQHQVVRLHASSGTTGKPTVVAYTQKDLETWTEVMARSLTMAGISNSDIMQVAYGYGLFTGGLGVHYGAEKVGASVIPISGGNTKKQLQLMEDFGSTVIACTPSYAAFLSESILAEKLLDKIKLKIGVFGAEPWTEEMRSFIQNSIGIKAYNIYGLSEIIGPGVSMECECQNGSHIFEDHFIPEIINPDTGEVLPEGELGELVFTTITKEALPLLRYRTRDLTTLHYDTCACGRTMVRMGRIIGRSDDMLIIRGVNVFPSQVESVLIELAETTPHYTIIVNRENNLDTLEIQVEVVEQYWTDEMKVLDGLKKKIQHAIANLLGINASIKLVEPNSMQRFEGKAQRVIDNRKL